MKNDNFVIAIYQSHTAAEAAINELHRSGFEMKKLSIIGSDYHTDEHVVGYYNSGDRMKVWGKAGAFWGGLWGLFLGGVFIMVPGAGQIMVLGHIAASVVSMLEGAALVGGASALGAALSSIGIPKNSIIQYETALKADEFLVTVRGPESELTRARAILGHSGPSSLELHPRGGMPAFTKAAAHAAG